MTIRTTKVDVAYELHAAIGECPVWDDRSSELLAIDIPAGLVHRFTPSGSRTTFKVGTTVGAVGLREDGGLVLALADGFVLADSDGRGITRVVGFDLDPTIEHFNDGKPDPWGQFVCGTRHVPRTSPLCALYRLAANGEVSVLLRDVQSSNGLGWSSDRRILYYVDSATGGIDAFDVDGDGSAIRFRARIANLEVSGGLFDGLTLDEQDCIWVACYRVGEVRRYTPTGILDMVLEMPTDRPTSCAFGGPELGQLFITTASRGMTESEFKSNPHAGDIFVFEPNVAGRLADRFAGAPAR